MQRQRAWLFQEGKSGRDPDLKDPVSGSEMGTWYVAFRDLGEEPR